MKISSNKTKRTFTIKTSYAKFRTIPFYIPQFMEAYYWGEEEWEKFLKEQPEKYVVLSYPSKLTV